MSFFQTTTFRRPRPLPTKRKAMNKVGKKGNFWLFVAKCLDLFFIQLDLPKVCENCHMPAGPNGPIDPAHTRRRADIRVGDWRFAFRVAALCQVCHFGFDSQGRRDAEPQIEAIIANRFKELGMTDADVIRLLIECAEH
jgi:hypothetical protein